MVLPINDNTMKIYIFILLLISITSIAQTKRYHCFEPTASDNVITRWNIPKDSLNFFKWYVEETSDKQVRVTELKFMIKGKVGGNNLCYNSNFNKYVYHDTYTIIENLLNDDGTPISGSECEMAYKTIYKLDKKLFLIKTIEYQHLDKVKMKKESIDSTATLEAANFVSYYFKSYSKLNRHFPMSRKAQGENILDSFKRDELENIEYTDALKCIISR
jgi:hypothetical protein